MAECFKFLSTDSSSRCVLFTSEGPVFTSGLDLVEGAQFLFSIPGEDIARKGFYLREHIKQFQEAFSSIEKVYKYIMLAF